MESSHGGSSSSNAPAPFLIKTYEMVDDPSTSSIVSWSHTGCSFVVWNPPEFAQDLLPKYFKHNNFSSFVRQLNTYGFRKIDPDQWEFGNEEFIRGQRHLLSNIRRRKPIHSHSLQNQGNTSPLTDLEKREYEEKIKRLKHDKSLLQMEVQRNEMEKQAFECQIMSLGERLVSMERRQMQLVSCLAQLAKKPGFASALMQQSDYHNKKRRLLEFNHFSSECNTEDNPGWRLAKENPDRSPASTLNFEIVDKLDSSIKCFENFLLGVKETSAQDMHDFRIVSPPSPVIFRQLSASSLDADTCSPRSLPSSPHSMDIPSSPELAGCINPVDNLKTSPPSFSDHDADFKPACAPVDEAVQESAVEATNPTAARPGVNDHFWEYYLTEAPGSTSIQELKNNQSKQADANNRTGDRHWWNTDGIHDLTKHMEHLAPAERT
eukprot:XP_015578895.1 heat stress transcription factor A-4a [Ricinus communis]